MDLKLTSEQVRNLHPDVYRRMQRKKYKSRAKDARKPLSEFNFHYSMSEMAPMHSVAKVVDRVSQRCPFRRRINWNKSKLGMRVYLYARKGSYRLCERLSEVPEPIIVECKRIHRQYRLQLIRVQRLINKNKKKREILEKLRISPLVNTSYYPTEFSPVE